MILTRNTSEESGIYGTLFYDDGHVLGETLEHSYLQPDGSYQPKVPRGDYICVRGMHRLAGMDHEFETFEITGVPGHTNILFHPGNFNKDSEGCVLLGEERNGDMITKSRDTFVKFMGLLDTVQQFTLNVS